MEGEIDTENVTWEFLATQGGAAAMVLAITQLTKGISFIDRLPTQLWSFFVALAVLLPAYYFTCGGLTLSRAGLAFFNAVVTALAANGGFEAVHRIFSEKKQ